jgi:hypothetical protein
LRRDKGTPYIGAAKGRELVIEAYGAVRTLRQVLANHPRLRAYEVPDWLSKGDIWTQ